AAVLGAGCWDGGRATAEKAMAAVQSSYDTVKADAARYLPEQAARIEQAVEAARQTFDQGEYMKALSDVRQIGQMVTQLGAVIEAKREALIRNWHEMSGRIPQVLDKLQSDIGALTRSTSLPSGVTRDAVDAAQRAIPVLRAGWEQAVSAFRETDPQLALERAAAVQARGVELMRSLGIPVPDALQERRPEPSETKRENPAR
ncbi:MAG: hypothetical protein AB7N65_25945, partial [Vicinamibacterales bacterium]